MAQFAAASERASGNVRARARYQSPALKAVLERALKPEHRRKVVRMRLVISAHGRDLRAAFSQPYLACVPIAP